MQPKVDDPIIKASKLLADLQRLPACGAKGNPVDTIELPLLFTKSTEQNYNDYILQIGALILSKGYKKIHIKKWEQTHPANLNEKVFLQLFKLFSIAGVREVTFNLARLDYAGFDDTVLDEKAFKDALLDYQACDPRALDKKEIPDKNEISGKDRAVGIVYSKFSKALKLYPKRLPQFHCITGRSNTSIWDQVFNNAGKSHEVTPSSSPTLFARPAESSEQKKAEEKLEKPPKQVEQEQETTDEALDMSAEEAIVSSERVNAPPSWITTEKEPEPEGYLHRLFAPVQSAVSGTVNAVTKRFWR